MHSSRSTRMLVASALLIALACLTPAVPGLDVTLLHLVPALVLLVPLLGGRYLGEDAIAAAAAAWVARAPRAASSLPVRGPRAPRSVVRGGALLARGLAERGPPALAAAR